MAANLHTVPALILDQPRLADRTEEQLVPPDYAAQEQDIVVTPPTTVVPAASQALEVAQPLQHQVQDPAQLQVEGMNSVAQPMEVLRAPMDNAAASQDTAEQPRTTALIQTTATQTMVCAIRARRQPAHPPLMHQDRFLAQSRMTTIFMTASKTMWWRCLMMMDHTSIPSNF